MAIALVMLLFVAARRPVPLAATAIAIAALAAFYGPVRPDSVLTHSMLDPEARSQREHYYGVGRSATVIVTELDGWATVRTNGLPEALIAPRGAPPARRSQHWLAALPAVARPDARSMLLIGYGGGIALEAAPPYIESIDVVELEPEVIAANRALSSFRDYDPLRDERVNIIYNDARNALRLTSRQYDIIASQPSHPWTAGASHLFTREFMQLSKERLTDDGVFVQWMNTRFVDELALRSLAATLADVFSNVRVYMPDNEILFFLASDSSLEFESRLFDSGELLGHHATFFSSLGLGSAEDFAAMLVLDESGIRTFASDAPISTDNRNRMATNSRSDGGGVDGNRFADMTSELDPLLQQDSGLRRAAAGHMNALYVLRRIVANQSPKRSDAFASSLASDSMRATAKAELLLREGRIDEAEAMLNSALVADPGNDEARFALVRQRIGSLAAGRADADVVAAAEQLTGSAAAVVDGWKLAADGSWDQLAQRDALLAAARPTDAWYLHAAQLRAEWRSKPAQGASRIRQLRAAVDIIDRAVVMSPVNDLLAIRALVGFQFGDVQFMLESIRALAVQMTFDLELLGSADGTYRDEEISVALARTTGLMRMIESPQINIPPARAADVLSALQTLQRRLLEMRSN
jgi:tetratricopeptide (TPR) repeat protein